MWTEAIPAFFSLLGDLGDWADFAGSCSMQKFGISRKYTTEAGREESFFERGPRYNFLAMH